MLSKPAREKRKMKKILPPLAAFGFADGHEQALPALVTHDGLVYVRVTTFDPAGMVFK